MKQKKSLIVLLVLIMAFSIVGCAKKEGQEDVQSKEEVKESNTDNKNVEVLKIGTTSPADTFSIAKEGGSFGKMNYNSFVAAAFVEKDQDNNLVGNIMESWEISDDQESMIAKFATDKDVKWHDGEDLTIDDIIFTFNYIKDVKKSGYVRALESIEKIDETTAKLIFEGPSAYSFLNSIAKFVTVYPEHIWSGIEDYKEYEGEDASIGCGPYKLVDIDEDAQVVTYESVDEYFKGDITVDKVLVKTYDNHDSLVMALKNGEIDAMYDYSNTLDSSMQPSITGVDDLDPGMSTNPGNFQLVFGFNKKPTDDLEFRQAVSKALNYELLATTIGGVDGEVAGVGIVSPVNVGFNDKLGKNERDIEKAKEILDNAGYIDVDGDGIREDKDGNKLSVLITPQPNETRKALYLRICEIVMEDLKNVGIDVVLDEESVRNKDYATEFRKSGQYELYVGYTSPGVASFDSAFMYMVPNENNPWGTCNIEEFVKTYDNLMLSKNTNDYEENLMTLQEIASENVVAIALAWDKAYFPFKTDRIKGWTNVPGYGAIHSNTWYTLYE